MVLLKLYFLLTMGFRPKNIKSIQIHILWVDAIHVGGRRTPSALPKARGENPPGHLALPPQNQKARTPEAQRKNLQRQSKHDRDATQPATTTSPPASPPPQGNRQSSRPRATAPRARNQMAPLCSASPRPLEAPGQPRRGARPPRTVAAAAGARASGAEARASLVLALASQALAASQRRAADLAVEAAKYAFPSRRFEPRTLEEALMTGQ